ncbi:MAG: hypothetical protein L0210_07620, partial [Rhodospirillales bacterium]|nr:hypothetical protein [Rhodospirillales bacterium]
MPRQQIIWTALPNGLRQPPSLTTLKLSVFVSPRLGLDGEATLGTLGAFPDFLDWPARMQSGQSSFKIVVNDNVAGAIPARIVTSPPPDSALWKALFNAQTPVRSHKFEAVRESLTSYPAKGTAGGIGEGYTKIGWNSPYRPASKEVVKGAFPSLTAAMQRGATPRGPTLARARSAVAQGPDALGRAHREIGENLLRDDPDVTFAEKLEVAMSVAGELARSFTPDEAVPIVPPTADDASPFIQFAAFHERLRGARDALAAGDRAASEADIIDFHQSLSALAEFPELLRRLGIVIDLEFTATDAM